MDRSTLPRFGTCVCFALVAVTSSACGDAASPPVTLDGPDVTAALAAIDPGMIEHHINVLADDSLEGRAPGTPGYEGGARYAEEALRDLGILPAGTDGTYRQQVPLRRSTVVEGESSMSVWTPVGTTELTYDTDFYLGANPLTERTDVETAPIAFVGFGVSAPALGYDD